MCKTHENDFNILVLFNHILSKNTYLARKFVQKINSSHTFSLYLDRKNVIDYTFGHYSTKVLQISFEPVFQQQIWLRGQVLESNVHQQVIFGNPTKSGTIPARLNVESVCETFSAPLPFSSQSPIQKSISINSMFHAGMEFFVHLDPAFVNSLKQEQFPA